MTQVYLTQATIWRLIDLSKFNPSDKPAQIT